MLSFVEGNLRSHDPYTGEIGDVMLVTWNWAGWSMRTVPAISEAGVAFVVAPPSLYAFEIDTHALLWDQSSNISGTPALAEGRVLALDSGYLVAWDIGTGEMLWRCEEALNLLGQVVAARGYAYVSSRGTTYAVDLSDGEIVWQDDQSGWLSLGAGRLLIADETGVLHSYRLTAPAEGLAP